MKIVEIEECLKILFDLARRRGIVVTDAPDKGYYWTIGSPDWLKIYEEPEPIIGSFPDDNDELCKMLEDPSRASAIDFDRVAYQLRLLSDLLAGMADNGSSS